MDKLKPAVEPNKPTCEQCMKEIPPSEAQSSEAADYIHHFCGAECYVKWLKTKTEQPPSEQGKSDRAG